ncbi:Uncharacterized protein YbcI [Mesobacillus persicus]|uniref:Uncharacterized protein YbcI n=2 Tax=Mesobacillus persicus TaxID=930146 RepID=A0A1H7VY28_9BACI|nr:Uncharacterized protein YbcI [Mesobacillus persicus]
MISIYVGGNMSKGELENKISRLITQWEKDYLGRGSLTVKTDILRNMIIVSLKGVLTPAEKTVAATFEGMMSVKQIRATLVESGTDQLKEIMTDQFGIEVISFHTDISTQTGERLMIFIMQENVEATIA